MHKGLPYRDYSTYLKEVYGEKVYKVPIKLDLTCPNRDGSCGVGGCIFCGEEGGSFENLNSELSVKEQIVLNKKYIGSKYKAKKFIAYFQNFTNTYQPLESFTNALTSCSDEDIVGITVSTRPDFLQDQYLQIASSFLDRKDITFELGLQTVNYHTLKLINRGHGLAEFIDGTLKLKALGFRVCVHLILDFPWDTVDDIIEAAKILNVLQVDEVKIHSLYVLSHTKLGSMYIKGEFKPLKKEDFQKRVILFLQYLDPNIIIQRILGRAPKEKTLFCNWNTSWWKIRDTIIETMVEGQSYQGQLYKKFNE